MKMFLSSSKPSKDFIKNLGSYTNPRLGLLESDN